MGSAFGPDSQSSPPAPTIPTTAAAFGDSLAKLRAHLTRHSAAASPYMHASLMANAVSSKLYRPRNSKCSKAHRLYYTSHLCLLQRKREGGVPLEALRVDEKEFAA